MFFPKTRRTFLYGRGFLAGKGIGAELLKRCLLISKERAIEKVWGFVLPENTQMLALGKN